MNYAQRHYRDELYIEVRLSTQNQLMYFTEELTPH
jgi:hypothetical protein